ncbi:unnamed protein product [Cylindrotheca closterium]|uniref:Uncharacterized protein n=1 Tax=Cylindrotheca closterium TaxID=2856 RepID=A0AAD2GDP0_9STRA|nr:unnamed protein product [Cylindrotheca closterium]
MYTKLTTGSSNGAMEQPPIDEFGPVRDRRDFEPLQLSLKRILPCPSRELSFSVRGGCWRYTPSVAFGDRLGSIRESSAMPSTKNTISNAWGDSNSSNSFHSTPDEDERRTRKRLSGLNLEEHMKRHRTEENAEENTNSYTGGKSTTCRTAVTVVSESTSSSSSIRKDATVNATVTVVSDVVPKAVLYSLYGKRKTQIPNKQYLTWNNGARTHELKFSAIFVCPISREVFLAGRYGSFYQQDGSIIWYNKKSLAEHAVAARAYDCYMLRDGDVNSTPLKLGIDPPYHIHNQPPLPREKIPRPILAALDSMRNMRSPQRKNQMPTVVRPTPPNKNINPSQCPF